MLYDNVVYFVVLDYAGDSCQLIKDFCTATTNCLYNSMPNTGTCTNLESGGFECTCQSGQWLSSMVKGDDSF